MTIRFLERLKKKHYIQCGIVVLLTVFFLYLASSLWLSHGIVVSFDVYAEKYLNYKVYYTEVNGQDFNENQTVTKSIKTKYNHVDIFLPIRNILKFRLDIYPYPGEIVIKKLKLKGIKDIKLNCNEFNYKHIDNFMTGNEHIILSSNQPIPYIVYKQKLDLSAKIHIDWCVLIIFATLAFLIFFKLVKYLAKFKIEKNYSRIDIVLLVVFFGLLCLPMSNISNAEKSEQENRMLASKPQLLIAESGRDSFSKQFNAWFNDRFFGRDLVLTIYNKLKYYIAPFSGNHMVLIGKDNWLFYKPDNGFENFANSTKLEKKSLKQGLTFLKSIDNWCKMNNIEFYYVIAPDKSKIYGEYYRLVKKQYSDENGIGYQFSNYIKENSDIKVLYLRDTLLKNKDKGLLYYKHDTHWSYLGAYYGYKALLKLMNIPSKSFNFKTGGTAGDLEKMLKYTINMDAEQYKIPKIINYCTSKENSQIFCTNPQENKKLFILRDSFAGWLIPYLSYHFNKISASHFSGYNFSVDNLKFIKDNADIFILENVERSIPNILNKTFPQNIKD